MLFRSPEPMVKTMAYRFNQWPIGMFLQEGLEAIGMDGCNDFEEVWMRLDQFHNVFVFEIVQGCSWDGLSALGVSS